MSYSKQSGEIERLQNPTPGDLPSQAAAWSAVWKALEEAGILSFIATQVMSGGRERAVQFIGFLADENKALKKAVATKELAND